MPGDSKKRELTEKDIESYFKSSQRKTKFSSSEFANAFKAIKERANDVDNTLAQIDYDRGAPILTAIQAIKAAQCLRYQSCEHPAFEDSLACKFIAAIIADAIPRLEGYDSAEWAISDKVTA